MNRMKCFVLMIAAAFVLAGCTPPAGNTPANSNANSANHNANANANANRAAASAPTKEALMTLEKSAYDAWKTKNTGFWDGFLTANFVGFSGNGSRLDRSAAMKEYAGTECDVKNVTMSDEDMMPLGADAVVFSHKTTVEGTCGGNKIPDTWAASVYVREGNSWKGAFHAETPVTDPNAPPAKSTAAAPAPPAASGSPAAGSDSMTEAMMAVEKQGWEAWKNRDANAVENVMAKDFVYFSGTGRRPRAEAIKGWSEPKCEGLAYSFSDPKSVQFTKDVAMVTYNADVKGSCNGKPNQPRLWVASIDVKEGEQWKNAFYMDSPR